MSNRRKFLAGLGALASGSAAAMGTGAFTSVEAERGMNVAVADDANAYLALSKTDNPNSQDYVTTSNGQIKLNLDGSDNGGSGFNKNAETRIDDIIRVSNQGTQTVNVWVTLDDGDDTDSDTFDDDTLYFYPRDSTETALNNGDGDADDGDDVLTLPPGKSANLGVYVDLGDISGQPDEDTTATFNADVDAGESGSSNQVAGVNANIKDDGGFSQVSVPSNKAFDSSILLNASGGSEIQIHTDSGGVEDKSITMTDNTLYDFKWEIDTSVVPPTATLSVTGTNTVSVTDTDITDGEANDGDISTGNPEFPNGVPDQVDIAISTKSTQPGIETIVQDVTVAGAPVTPSEVSVEDGPVEDRTKDGSINYEDGKFGIVAMELDDISVPDNGTLAVEGQFEFATDDEKDKSDASGQESVGISVAPGDVL